MCIFEVGSRLDVNVNSVCRLSSSQSSGYPSSHRCSTEMSVFLYCSEFLRFSNRCSRSSNTFSVFVNVRYVAVRGEKRKMSKKFQYFAAATMIECDRLSSPRKTLTKVLSSSPSSVTKASTKRSNVAAFTNRTRTVSHSRCDISSSLSFCKQAPGTSERKERV